MNIEELSPLFLYNMKNLLGEDFDLYLKEMGKDSIRGVRFNPLKINKKTALENFNYELEQLPYEENGYVLKSKDKLGNSLMHLSGAIYMQEPSSMMPVACLKLSDDAIVLDMCAAPGGKSTQAAVKIPRGLLVSNEIITSRSKILFQNIERLGIENSIILNDTPQNISEKLPNFFDAVIVDAPCGGEGMFRKDPDTINEWSIDRIRSNHERQIDILESANNCLRTGGKLIYSTCTFSEVENEDVILEFLKKHHYKVLDVTQDIKNSTKSGTTVTLARRFYPFTGTGEGQFVCMLEKCEDSLGQINKPKKSKYNVISHKDKLQVREFLSKNFDIPCDYELISAHDSIMLVLDGMMQVVDSGVNIVNAGVRVGTIEKGIIKPHHQLFSAFGKYSKFKYELTENQALKYVHGEELYIDGGENAYYTVTYLGSSIGGGKCVQGRLKNLYPKGLRI